MRRSTLSAMAGIGLGALLLSGCSVSDDDDLPTTSAAADATPDGEASSADSTDDTSIDLASLTEAASVDDLGIEEVDLDVDTAEATAITLADGASSVDGSGASVDGDTFTITDSGTYVLSGTLSAGQVVVDGDKADVTLVLDGVDITADAVAGIEVVDADWVVLALADGSTNSVADASGATESDEDDAPNAAIYATSDLWITGDGALSVTGVAADGITSKDSLVIDSGTVAVAAADDGIRGKDHLVMRGGDVIVEAGGDGLKADNEADADDASALVGRMWISGGNLDITAGSDAMDAYNQITIEGGDITIAAEDDAVHADGILRITAGTIDVTTSYEGLEGALIYLDDGTATVVSSDDGINASDGTGSSEPGMGGDAGGEPGGAPGGGDATGGRPRGDGPTSDARGEPGGAPGAGGGDQASDAAIEITGGEWFFTADGDGLDSNGDVLMTGGTVVVAGPTNAGNGAIDYNGTFRMDGGTLLATGSAGMAQAPDEGSQAVVAASLGDTIAAGTPISVTDADGNLVAAITPAKDAQTLVLSTPGLIAGDAYTITLDGTVTGSELFGLITDGTLSGGESAGTIEAS